MAKASAQDDVRENRVIDLFNLVRPPNRVRHGVDAVLPIDGHELKFELKSVTKIGGSVSTVRDLGPDHIAKWKDQHWIIAFYDGADLDHCRYGTPNDMKAWISKIWDYIKLDFELATLVPAQVTMEIMTELLGDQDNYTIADARRLHKNQFSAAEYKAMTDLPGGYSRDRMLEILRRRARYVIERGSTLNNPHIPSSYFTTWPAIKTDHAVRLRELAREWLAAQPPESLAQGDTT